MNDDQPTHALEDLGAAIEELEASRSRVVRVADARSRTIERRLHDEVQQQLVALAVGAQLARDLVATDPRAAVSQLEQMGRDVRCALEDVRALAAWVYPPLLLDRGLVDAVTAAASAHAIPTRVDAEPLGRLAPQVEAAAYFCCVGALANTTRRRAGVTRVSIVLRLRNGALQLEVEDDGTVQAAGEPDDAELVALCDRIAALGGKVDRSVGPTGTRVTGRIPLPS